MHNEGETDPLGRFMAGTKPARGEPMEGKEEEVLWRIEGGKEGGRGDDVERIIEGMGLPNGMGWSKDGKTLSVHITSLLSILVLFYKDPYMILLNRL